jgi:hypothetical protein
MIAFDRAITLEGKRASRAASPTCPSPTATEMHMHTDYPGVVMRRMFTKLLADPGETEQRAGPCP